MSLVVAHKAPQGELVIVADTRVTHRYGKRQPPNLSCAKLLVLRADFAVGFAGESLRHIDNAIKSIPTDCGPDRWIEHLADCSAGGDFSCVVAQYQLPPWLSLDKGSLRSSLRIVKVHQGSAKELGSAWVGSQSAFSHFQGLMHGGLPDEGDEGLLNRKSHFNGADAAPQTPYQDQLRHKLQMTEALGEIVNSGLFPTVGDFAISVISTPSGFRYSTGVAVFAGGPAIVQAKENVLPRPVGEGGYSLVTLEGPVEGNVAGPRFPAIYFPQGSFGYLYLPTDASSVPHAKKVDASSARQFVDEAQNLGVLLHGFVVGDEGYTFVDAHEELLRHRLLTAAGGIAAIWSVGRTKPKLVFVDQVLSNGQVGVVPVTLGTALRRLIPFVSLPPPQPLLFDRTNRARGLLESVRRRAPRSERASPA